MLSDPFPGSDRPDAARAGDADGDDAQASAAHWRTTRAGPLTMVSSGDEARRGLAEPRIELTTTGAKSGTTRTTMLAVPLRSQGNLVVIAPKGGASENPAWYHSLVANPQVTVTEKGKRTMLRARVLTPQEREELWPKVVAASKGRRYQEKTARTIPVVVMESL